VIAGPISRRISVAAAIEGFEGMDAGRAQG
jgi:hypothetical protein